MSKKLIVKPGDILAIPTTKNGNIGYILARVIEKNQSSLIEFFDKFYNDFNVDKNALAKKIFTAHDRLFPPLRVILLFDDTNGADKWKIVAHSKTLNVNEAKKGMTFLMYSYNETGIYIQEGYEKIDLPENRNRIAEEQMFWQVGQVMFRVQFYMDGIYTKGEIFDTNKIFAEYYKKGVFLNMLENCHKISREVLKRFKKPNL